MIETLKIIAGVAGSLITLISFATLIIKPVRNFVIEKIRNSIEILIKKI